MTTHSDNVIIKIGGSDLSVYIDEYTESGGEKNYSIVPTFNQNSKRIFTGAEPYVVELHFRTEPALIGSLYNGSDTTIELTLGSDMIVTYYHMIPTSLNVESEVDNISYGMISYSAPSYDKTNNRYNRVITSVP